MAAGRPRLISLCSQTVSISVFSPSSIFWDSEPETEGLNKCKSGGNPHPHPDCVFVCHQSNHSDVELETRALYATSLVIIYDTPGDTTTNCCGSLLLFIVSQSARTGCSYFLTQLLLPPLAVLNSAVQSADREISLPFDTGVVLACFIYLFIIGPVWFYLSKACVLKSGS